MCLFDHTSALAAPTCTKCKGSGKRGVKGDLVCGCSARAVFRICMGRFHFLGDDYLAFRSPLSRAGSGEGAQHKPLNRIRIAEDFRADVCLIARRTLVDNPLEHQVFQLHCVAGADWKACCSLLGINRGAFFHAVYRVQERLGTAFADTQPFGVYPLDTYFARVPFTAKLLPFIVWKPHRNGVPLRPPLQKAA